MIFRNETRYYDVNKRNDSICYSYNNNEDRILKQFGIKINDNDNNKEVNVWMIME